MIIPQLNLFPLYYPWIYITHTRNKTNVTTILCIQTNNPALCTLGIASELKSNCLSLLSKHTDLIQYQFLP